MTATAERKIEPLADRLLQQIKNTPGISAVGLQTSLDDLPPLQIVLDGLHALEKSKRIRRTTPDGRGFYVVEREAPAPTQTISDEILSVLQTAPSDGIPFRTLEALLPSKRPITSQLHNLVVAGKVAVTGEIDLTDRQSKRVRTAKLYALAPPKAKAKPTPLRAKTLPPKGSQARAVIRALAGRKLTRAEIASVTKISPNSVSAYLHTLKQTGLVEETGTRAGNTPGKPPIKVWGLTGYAEVLSLAAGEPAMIAHAYEPASSPPAPAPPARQHFAIDPTLIAGVVALIAFAIVIVVALTSVLQ